MADEKVTVDKLVTDHAARNAPPEKDKPVNDPPPEGDKPTDTKNDPPPVDDSVKNLLKELNVDSLDALKEKLKPKEEDKPVVESPEQKEKRENLYKVELQRYAVETGEMKPEDFVTLENLKAKDDRSLVYDRWLPSWKEENPDVDPAVADQQAREDFEKEYHLNSENEKTKARGLSKITREAKEIRDPLEKSFGKVKAGFDEELDQKKYAPEVSKKVSSFIQENIPEKVKMWEGKAGEEAVAVEVTLTPDQRKAVYEKVHKRMMNTDVLALYKKGDFAQIQAIAKKEAENTIWADHREDALKKTAEMFLAKGAEQQKSKSPGVGARNPFPLNEDNKKPDGKDFASNEQQVLNSLRGKK